MTYSNVYKNIKKETIELTKLLPKQGLWKKDVSKDQKIEAIQNFLLKVSEIYNIEVPKFKFIESDFYYRATGGGTYTPSSKEITLYNKFSLVTLLHEFRHHMQHEGLEKLYKDDLEEDARAWSVSLFKSACPKSYKNAVEKGILHFN